jgi:hypothetical protein
MAINYRNLEYHTLEGLATEYDKSKNVVFKMFYVLGQAIRVSSNLLPLSQRY